MESNGTHQKMYIVSEKFWDRGKYELDLSPKDLLEISDLSQILVKGEENKPIPVTDPYSPIPNWKETACITELTDLDLALIEAQLKDFPAGLTKLTNLVELSLNHNEFTSISPSITELKSLKRFLIAHNQIRELPSELFTMHLKALNLNKNRLQYIDPAIRKLRFLRKLALDSNMIAVVPRELFELVCLKYLSLGDNLLHELPPQLGNLRELETLRLCENPHLKDLPSTTTLLTKLTEIDLQNTGLKNVGFLTVCTCLTTLAIGEVAPANTLLVVLHALPRLEKLYMPWDALRQPGDKVVNGHELTTSNTGLESCTAFPRNLVELELSYNRLLRIPTNISLCDKLCHLDLTGNFIKEVPTEISSLTNLEHLLLGDNSLSALPDSLSQLTKLQTLGLQINQFEELPTHLYNLVSLYSLNVMHNPCGLAHRTQQAASVATILYNLAGKKCINVSQSLFKHVSQSQEVTLRTIKILLHKLRKSLDEKGCSPLKIPDFLLEHECITILYECIHTLEGRMKRLSEYLVQTDSIAETFLPLASTLTKVCSEIQSEWQFFTECLRYAIILQDYLRLYKWLSGLLQLRRMGFACGNPLDVMPWCKLPRLLKLKILQMALE
jgi:Leucine-rich repeat (LRR) protein